MEQTELCFITYSCLTMMLNVNCLRAWVFFLLFRFDPDQEIESLEKKEEEEKKKKQEKARIMNMNAVPANLDLKGKCALSTSQSETETMRILDQELSVCLSFYRPVCLPFWPSVNLPLGLSPTHRLSAVHFSTGRLAELDIHQKTFYTNTCSYQSHQAKTGMIWLDFYQLHICEKG